MEIYELGKNSVPSPVAGSDTVEIQFRQDSSLALQVSILISLN
jgi:hypothetical protein